MPRIGATEKDEMEGRMVEKPPPLRAPAGLPTVRRPSRDAEVLALERIVERLEIAANENVGVGPGRIGAPDDLSGVLVERRHPTAHAQPAAAVADENLSLHDQPRHGDRLTLIDVAERVVPELLSAFGVFWSAVVVE